jgi:hypothetical protein
MTALRPIDRSLGAGRIFTIATAATTVMLTGWGNKAHALPEPGLSGCAPLLSASPLRARRNDSRYFWK